MNRKTKGWIIAATLLVIIGLAIFAGVMLSLDWDFRELSTEEYETNVHEVSEKFDDISINTDTADIAFVRAEDGECRVVCRETEKVRHSVLVEDDTLAITCIDSRDWRERISIATETPAITVYLPRAEYESLFIAESTGDISIPKDFRFENIAVHTSTGDVECYASAEETFEIETDTGDITVEKASAGRLELSVTTGHIALDAVDCEGDVKISVSTGKANINEVKCENLISYGDTGDITLVDVIAAGTFVIERSTGDVRFERCDAAGIFVSTDTGDITGSLLGEKYFIAESDTGDVDVPQTMGGGKCEISSNTGDIEITEA